MRSPENKARTKIAAALKGLSEREKVIALAGALKDVGLPFFSTQLLEVMLPVEQRMQAKPLFGGA